MQFDIPGGRVGNGIIDFGFPARTFDQYPRGGVGTWCSWHAAAIKVVDTPMIGANSVMGWLQMACCRFRGHRDKVFMKLENLNDEKNV
ncbi:hypothetical protein, partial [uncultured Sulfitobacter sp.]|uniref:hypothetical protein n=1 Tax=uncultured Sulfitobacter sp. TaxID=191468 RepID=UPI0026305CDC